MLLFSDVTYKMIELNGRNVILFNKYTFSKIGSANFNYYGCSKKSMLMCKARISFDKDWNIKQVFDEHNHPPPNLFVTPSGKYYLVR